MRVTGGQLAGRRLSAPRGSAVRPTSDRVRESLFARLEPLDGVTVLDLFAGTGALGIEALSRGAASAVFVERAGPSLRCLERNLEVLGLGDRARVLRSEVHRAIRRLARSGPGFSLVLMDPPYEAADAVEVMREVRRCGILAPGGVLVLETSRRHPPGRVPGLVPLDERLHGDTLIVRYQARQAGGPPGAGRGGSDET